MIRKLAKRGSPTITISIQDGNYHVKSDTGFMTQVMSYPIDGTEIDEEYRGGGKAKVSEKIPQCTIIVLHFGLPACHLLSCQSLIFWHKL